LREAVALRKSGIVALKDPVTGAFQVTIDLEPSCRPSDWCQQLCGVIQQLKPLKSLELKAGGECVEDLLACLDDESPLIALRLAETPLTDRGLERIGRFASLEVLDLSQTRITDHGLAHLAGLAKLSRLALFGTNITTMGMQDLRTLTALKSLEINWTEVDDDTFMTLAQLPALRHVDMRGTPVTFSAVKAFTDRRADVTLNWAPALLLIGCWSDDIAAGKRAFAGVGRRKAEPEGDQVAGEASDEANPFIHPRLLVDPTWAQEDRSRVVQYLASAQAVAWAGGPSYCRFGCGGLGHTEQSDGLWIWPDGLAHYVEHHDIRLPDEFLNHVRNQGYRPEPPEEMPIQGLCRSENFWRSWCASQKRGQGRLV
jgi:hypothetical protein